MGQGALGAGERRQADRPLARAYGIDEPLGLDYTFDYKPYYTSKSWEDSFFGYLSSIAVKKPVTEWQQAYNDHGQQRPRRHRQPLDRRAEGGEAADRHRAGGRQHPPADDLLHQLVGPQGLQVPRLRQDRRARPRHRLRLRRQPRHAQDRRVGWHDARRRGDRPRQPRGQPRVVLRPVRRAGELGRQLRRRRRRPRRRRRRRLPHPGVVGVRQLPQEVRAAARSRQGRPLRRPRPPARLVLAAVPAVLHGGPRPGPRRPRHRHTRGLGGLDASRNTSRSRCSCRRSASCRPASTTRPTRRTCRSPATSSAASRASSPTEGDPSPASRAWTTRRTRTCSWPPPSTRTSSSRATATTRRGWSTSRRRTRRLRSATPTTTGSTARRAASSASSRRASSTPATA